MKTGGALRASRSDTEPRVENLGCDLLSLRGKVHLARTGRLSCLVTAQEEHFSPSYQLCLLSEQV